VKDEVRYAVGLDSTVDRLMEHAREQGRREALVEIHKPPNTKVIDTIYVGMSEDKNGYNGIIATVIEGFGGAPMVTASEKVLALFKAQASMVAKEFGTRVVIYRFARAEIEYDTDKPRG
jgi:hypothetical protein